MAEGIDIVAIVAAQANATPTWPAKATNKAAARRPPVSGVSDLVSHGIAAQRFLSTPPGPAGTPGPRCHRRSCRLPLRRRRGPERPPPPSPPRPPEQLPCRLRLGRLHHHARPRHRCGCHCRSHGRHRPSPPRKARRPYDATAAVTAVT
jgi:hypothetical protein